MRLQKVLFSALVACGLTANGLYAADDDNAPSERDIQAVKRFIEDKRAITVKEIGGDLSISGDVRFEYQHTREKLDGVHQRGPKSAVDNLISAGQNNFDVEVNLYLDYTADRTWASIKLEFDNDAGVTSKCKSLASASVNATGSENCGSGQCDSICLERAIFGYNIFESGDARLDIEFGRRNLSSVFDSRIQFSHRFDGAFMKYTNNFEEIGHFHLQGAWFVIDEVVDNHGYAFETGLSNIAETGLDFKYSFIDWKTKQIRRTGVTSLVSDEDGANCLRVFNFRTSQFTAAYTVDPHLLEGYLDKSVKFYGAVLVNHAASSDLTASGKKENIGGYAGVKVGKVKKEGDWSVDFNYQYVEAQAVADKDVLGIGRGNKKGACYPAAHVSGFYVGNANFEGFQLEGLYAITNNLTINLEAEWSCEASLAAAGGVPAKWHKYEAEFIYAF